MSDQKLSVPVKNAFLPQTPVMLCVRHNVQNIKPLSSSSCVFALPNLQVATLSILLVIQRVSFSLFQIHWGVKVGVGAVCLEANRKRPCGVDVVCWVVGVYVAAGGCGVDESPLTW